MRYAAAVFVSFAMLTLPVGCSSLEPDPPAPYEPSPLGNGDRVADVTNPGASTYAPGQNVDLTSLVALWQDEFDETRDGKSVGTVYFQDVGSQAPYSGLSAFEASFVPADIRIFPGDVFDVVGEYEESLNVGTAVFPTPQTLPQLARPVCTFRYEYVSPPPTPVPLSDLNDYDLGRKWEGMLVTVKDVYIDTASTDSSGRVTYSMVSSAGQLPPNNSVAISNELYALQPNAYPSGTHFASVTGIVTWFYSYHVAPRTPADLDCDCE